MKTIVEHYQGYDMIYEIPLIVYAQLQALYQQAEEQARRIGQRISLANLIENLDPVLRNKIRITRKNI